jgi:hypothetical protein
MFELKQDAVRPAISKDNVKRAIDGLRVGWRDEGD